MDKPISTVPRSLEGMNMSWNLNLFSGPKFIIGCGNCPHAFKQRLLLVDDPTAICPACGAINVLPLRLVSHDDTGE